MYRNNEPSSNSYDDADDEFITTNDLNGHNNNPQGSTNINNHSTNHNTSAATTSNNTSSSSFYDRQYQQYLSDSQSKDSQDYEDEHTNMGMNMGMTMTAMKDDIYDDDGEESDEGIETITLEYDMGLTSHSSTTKLCSRWCRRSFCVYNCFCRKIITLFSKCGILCCKKPTEEIGDGLEDKPSNEELLSIAFLSFLVFTMCQGVAAYFAKSEAMMGDSIAMAVDAFTYGFNLIAERMKGNPSYTIPFLKINRYDDYDDDNDDNDDRMRGRKLSEKQRERIQKRCKRKQKLVLELVPPIISVTTLFVVTIIILHGSISVLVLDSHRDASQQTRPNVVVMFAFSLLNLVVDGVNILFFSKADHAFGYDTVEAEAEAEAGSGYNYDGDGYGVDGDGDGDDDDDGDHNSDANNGDHDASLNGGDNAGRGRGRSHDAGIEIRPSTSSSSMNMKGAQHQGLNANYTSTHPSPRTGKDAKKEIADSLKLIMREKRRRKGGAYAQINNMDLSYEYDDHDDNDNKHDDSRNVYNGKNSHFDKDEQDTHNPLDFSIDEGDEDNDGHDMNRHRIHGDGNGNGHGSTGSSPLHHQIPSIHSIDEEEAEHHLANYEAEKGQANLNMCSAYTHVFADSVRSIAVLVAAVLGEYIDVVTPEVADASAAVIVSAIILIALLPLLAGVYRTWCELSAIRREEASERIMDLNHETNHTRALTGIETTANNGTLT